MFYSETRLQIETTRTIQASQQTCGSNSKSSRRKIPEMDLISKDKREVLVKGWCLFWWYVFCVSFSWMDNTDTCLKLIQRLRNKKDNQHYLKNYIQSQCTLYNYVFDLTTHVWFSFLILYHKKYSNPERTQTQNLGVFAMEIWTSNRRLWGVLLHYNAKIGMLSPRKHA